MEYHIFNEDGKCVASFKHESDRDLCFGAFEDTSPDCPMTRYNDEGGFID